MTARGVRYEELTAVLAKAIQELATTTAFISSEWASTSPAFSVTAEGNIGIATSTPAYKLHVMGDVAATSFVNISTREEKKDISYLSATDGDSVLAKIKALNVATYRYNIEPNSNPLRLGLIAEEVPSEILAAGGKGVDIYKLSTFILAGVKSQQSALEALGVRIARLEAAQPGGSASSGGIADYLQTMGVRLSATVAQFKNVIIDTLTVGSAEKPSGITLFDEVTKQPYCMKISNGTMVTSAGECGAQTAAVATAISDASPTPASSEDAVPPVITVNGSNPARVEKGTSYLDLGATVSDNTNTNLGVTVVGDQIDTAVVGEYTVRYSATDQAGNRTEATRTVIVFDPVDSGANATDSVADAPTADPAPVPEPVADAPTADPTPVENN